MATKTYSNGTERIDADGRMFRTGVPVYADLRTQHGFYTFEAGGIDAPEWIAAGAMLRFVSGGFAPVAVPAISLRN